MFCAIVTQNAIRSGPVAFASDGSFSQTLDQSRLTVGDHKLTVTARDTAGNVTHDTVNLNLATPPPLMLSGVMSAVAISVGFARL